MIVTPEQRREIARAFALHESVAGPLSWYAADDSTIQVAPAGRRKRCSSRLRSSCGWRRPDGKERRTQDLRDCVPQQRRGDHRTAAVGGGPDRSFAAAFHGGQRRGATPIRHCGRRGQIADRTRPRWPAVATSASSQTPLGQLALDDRLVNVDASAWVIRDERKP